MNKHTYIHTYIYTFIRTWTSIYKLKQIQKSISSSIRSLFNFACYTSNSVFKYLTTHFTHNINYGFHTLPPKWLVLVQQMLDVIIFSETCGATVQPAVHQRRTHYTGRFKNSLLIFISTSTAYPWRKWPPSMKHINTECLKACINAVVLCWGTKCSMCGTFSQYLMVQKRRTESERMPSVFNICNLT